ncbi:Non-specific serine/threonine protein kinase protein [Dioscorea alata]|uniref:Non-specific serine/threonine protein kinase protein n=1 Tax=Dioscorea alata TaxID=55571 RepID=A0ACB7W288_DIOAL|nr:Non-specific serine/threonine protein kinase protein [Dioscorea alata]
MDHLHTKQCISWLSLLSLLFPFRLYSIHCTTEASFLPGIQTDKAALLAFMAGITDDPFGVFQSWNDSKPFCDWTGISCSKIHPGRVISIQLDSQSLSGFISSSITNLTFLHSLLLMNNSFSGGIPPDIGMLPRLQHLNLSYNSLTGVIPLGLSNCSDLLTLGLHYNQLHGNIPSEFGSLMKLQELVLAKNNFTGSIPSSLSNISTLVKLSLLSNFIQGSIPEKLGLYATNLSFLQLSQNEFSGTIPPTLFNLSSLSYFGVAVNQFHGSLPLDIGTSLPNLQALLLSDNQFGGTLPASLINATRIRLLDMSTNSIGGKVPSELGKLQDLVHLNLGSNKFEINDPDSWRFMDSLTNCSKLQVLALNRNNVSGVLPESVGNLSTNLQLLMLWTNSITGRIPSGIENLINLEQLQLSKNKFIGTIPDGIGKLTKLQNLVLFFNDLTGQLPSSIGNLTQLLHFYVSDNTLTGRIPSSLGNLQNIEAMDLSNNGFNGSIPEEILSLSSLSFFLDLSGNSLSGQLPAKVGSLKNLGIFGLSRNKLSGAIPATLGSCQQMETLLMDNNLFEGTIPASLGNIKGLQELNLSHNRLKGPIPDSLAKLHGLTSLDLSFNHLSGEVYQEGVFKNATAVSLLGNDGLCGGISSLNLPPCLETSSKKTKWSRSLKIAVIVPIVAFILLLIFFSSLAFLYRRKRLRKKSPSIPSFADKYLKVSYNELFKATDGFSSSNLLGTGSFGSVYRGTLDPSGTIVAVKVFNLQQRGASKSFIAECEALRGIRHRSLIKILTACSSIDSKGDDFKALVYEFMNNGSLETWLHPEDAGFSNQLSLVQKLNIAVDVADALEYLHVNCQPSVIHCDLKPSNILLDDNMNALVGDFGLARILSETMSISQHDSLSLMGIKGSIGYIAPEYGAGIQVSTSGDVYSYGILLLEIFTGKRPVDDMFNNGLELREYVHMAFPDRVMKIVDPAINENTTNGIKQRAEEECLVSVIRIGLACSERLARDRMSTRDVASEMHAVRDAYFKAGQSQ